MASVGLGIDAKKIKIVRNKLIKFVINDFKLNCILSLLKEGNFNSLLESHAFLGFSQALSYPEYRSEMEIDGK